MTLATVAIALPVESAPPSPIDCFRRPAAEATIFAPAGAAEVSNWVPGCVRVAQGGSVTFTNADALPHVPFAAGCFDGGSLGVGQSAELAFSYDEEVGTVIVEQDGIPAECDDGAQQQREGRIPFGSTGDFFPVVEVGEDTVFLHFICDIHGAAMKGVIEIDRNEVA